MTVRNAHSTVAQYTALHAECDHCQLAILLPRRPLQPGVGVNSRPTAVAVAVLLRDDLHAVAKFLKSTVKNKVPW